MRPRVPQADGPIVHAGPGLMVVNAIGVESKTDPDQVTLSDPLLASGSTLPEGE